VAKVDQLKATIDADVAAIESAQTQLDYTTIQATSDGRIGVRSVDPGNIVHASDAGSIATLVSTQPMTVLFTLPARSLDDVRQAMAAGTIDVTAYDQDNQKVLSTGKLMMVDNVIDQTTAMFRLKATFANTDERLWPGEFVNARLFVGDPQQRDRGSLDRRPARPAGPVRMGRDRRQHRGGAPDRGRPDHRHLTLITSGVNDGDRVVTDGQYKLQPNVPVTVSSPKSAAGGRGNT